MCDRSVGPGFENLVQMLSKSHEWKKILNKFGWLQFLLGDWHGHCSKPLVRPGAPGRVSSKGQSQGDLATQSHGTAGARSAGLPKGRSRPLPKPTRRDSTPFFGLKKALFIAKGAMFHGQHIGKTSGCLAGLFRGAGCDLRGLGQVRHPAMGCQHRTRRGRLQNLLQVRYRRGSLQRHGDNRRGVSDHRGEYHNPHLERAFGHPDLYLRGDGL